MGRGEGQRGEQCGEPSDGWFQRNDSPQCLLDVECREGSLEGHCGPADLGSWKNKRKTEVVADTEWKPGQQDWEERSDDFSSSFPSPSSFFF